jgi:hypothetical protein
MQSASQDQVARRLAVPAGAPFDDFRAHYEAAVPPFDAAGFEAVKGDGWDAVLAQAAENAPHEFMRYATIDAGAIFEAAGHPQRCAIYLMGNHTIAERMFGHDPGVMLYAPLRVAIYEDLDGAAWFSIDQPSTRFGAFGDPAITAVGHELDHKVGALLELLGMAAPEELRS